ncbi:methyl-accepting chemotaxis protein [Psychrobacillus sp. NEAU-3TGS]|uniref:methyl-accepting chemotaxis protein n=1 Tax=Psychrobacillus sp. NEAU-3TGS TaxID=2995412 RepID=UPI0024995317|nr:methyl-accepting chemotaxis protein [Psychrobacillus sp. NEAU-3TGS]MDI2589113.1 methyl-accepting chemotaxis protein [Psychrobacillus sp. NEAU-3TGS]
MKWTINKKLIGGFSAVLLLLIIMIGISYSQITAVNNSYTDLLDDKAMKAVEIRELQVAVKQEIIAMRGYLILGDERSLQEHTTAVSNYKTAYNALLSKFKIPVAIEMLEDINQIQADYEQFSEKVFDLRKQKKFEEYEALVSTEGKEIVVKLDEAVAKLSDFQNDLLHEGGANNTLLVKNTIMLVLAIGVIAVLVGIAIAIVIGRLISNPVVALANSARKMAEGDLSGEMVKVKNKDEIGDLVGSFNLMAENLRMVIEQVGMNSNHVAASAEELTASAEQTSQATEQIATSIQDIASGSETQVVTANESSEAMKEMAVGIQRVAETSSTVSESAIETNKEANLGNESLRQMIHQMDTIHNAVEESALSIKKLGNLSQEIGNIIAVITGIADQTNLLALNAAIEAARAGEHGQGFAVVADEVRKLAEQSRDSADQIAGIINQIQADTSEAVNVMEIGTKEVATGKVIVDETGMRFEKILLSIEQVTAQIQEVSAISEEMSAGVEEVNASIEEMAKIAQYSASNTQNVASASEEQLASMEEITASATSLSKMAEDLQAIVRQFKL